MQTWVKTLTPHTSSVAWPGYLTSQAEVSFPQGEEQITLVVQWLGLCAFIAGDIGSFSGQRTKILHAMAPLKKKKKKEKAILPPDGLEASLNFSFVKGGAEFQLWPWG